MSLFTVIDAQQKHSVFGFYVTPSTIKCWPKIVVGQFDGASIVTDDHCGMRKPELWIGLVELRPLKKGHGKPAFTNILTWASDSESFRAKADNIAAKLNMYVIGVEGEEPLAARRERSELTEEDEEMLSRASSNPNAIVYGTFHTFPDDSN